MISQAVIAALEGFVPKENIHKNEPMSRHTTFRIGGEADCLIEVEDTDQLIKVLEYIRKVEIPFFVLGNGSNLLVSDEGYRGIIIKIGNKMSKITVEGNHITAQAGVRLGKVAAVAMEHDLKGLAFASGIPGTIGGAVVMNAGAYGGEMCQVITSVTVVSEDGEVLQLDNPTMEFGYRTSIIKKRPLIVVEAQLELSEGNKDEIRAEMEELAGKRIAKQPLEYPSAGSTFKRPEGYFAGELIQKSGLAGFRVGEAEVSTKHCGFVINTGNATASDVMQVIRGVQKKVLEVYGVELEPEVIFLGEFREDKAE